MSHQSNPSSSSGTPGDHRRSNDHPSSPERALFRANQRALFRANPFIDDEEQGPVLVEETTVAESSTSGIEASTSPLPDADAFESLVLDDPPGASTGLSPGVSTITAGKICNKHLAENCWELQVILRFCQ